MAIQLRASSSFSSVPFSTRSYTHDVFLSFRGEDTRRGFTGHLYRTLVDKGINTFIDDELPRGEEISQSLLGAIEGSKLSLIVFSENYAASKWCLDELVHILECRRSKNHMVRPIFLTVDPSDVRSQSGTYGEALAAHEGRINKDKVLNWREALSEAGSLSGWHFKDGYEYKFIDQIIKEISPHVKEPTKLDVAECPVGIDSRVQDMLKLIDVGGSDVRMVGIWGIGGIGKTTIAKAVYNTIACQFECSCYLANVREEFEQLGGLVKLQNALLSDIMKEKGLEIKNVDEGITLLSKSLRHKKILLVLDDVDDLGQLKKLAGKIDWFGRGSRVIITTRDSQLLNAHEVKPIYKVPELAHHEAVELFSSNAFKGGKSLDDNEKLLVATMVKYAQGIPLALEVLGSHPCNKSVDEWESVLDDFRLDPPKCIQDILNISYVGLREGVRKVFLDIACFFKGWKRNDVIQILEGCNRFNPTSSIRLLEQKALIYVEGLDNICMHDLLEEMGRNKVLLESKEPGERSRLWQHKDVQDVLTESTGTSKIEGIIVKMPTEDEIHLSPKCFKQMKNLMIFINVNARFCGKVDPLPTQLRLLDWSRCPLHSLPSNFNTSNIVHLKMPDSRLSHLGFKRMQNLKSLNLSGCAFLAQSPDLSGSPNLEFLDLRWCKSLVEVHPSVGSLEKLVHLDLKECSNLVKLPGKVNWRSLQTIRLGGCRRLESFPEIAGEMKHLTFLLLWDTGIKALPSSIRYLFNLQSLYLTGCREFIDLPGSIYELHELRTVELVDCPKLVTFPNKVDSEVGPTYSTVDDSNGRISHLEFKRMQNLKSLNLSGCAFLAQGPDLSGSPNLEFLGLSGCKSLVEVHSSVGSLEKLVRLDLGECSNLVKLPGKVNWRSLQTIRLGGCRRLESFPEIVGEMKHLTSLRLSHTGIKALPSSIRYLINLESLELWNCREFRDLPGSIYELHELHTVELEDCPKLVTFPNKVDSEVGPTYSTIDDSNGHISHLEFKTMQNLKSLKLIKCDFLAQGPDLSGSPNLEFLDLSGCKSLVEIHPSVGSLEKLVHLYLEECFNLVKLPGKVNWRSLQTIRLRGCRRLESFPEIVGEMKHLTSLSLCDTGIKALPSSIRYLINLKKLELSGCSRLVEIPELPPGIEKLDVSDCVSLERISKLSNILERKESQIMIEETNLTNCWRLCDNLVEMAKEEAVELDADIFSSLLSSQQSGFQATFPVRKSKVPEWFSRQMDFNGHKVFEFDVEVLENFKWENLNTGLAICVAADQNLQDYLYFTVHIYINETRVTQEAHEYVYSTESDHVWLQYKPFHKMGKVCYMPPFSCRVIIHLGLWGTIKSCGVHLVMPPNEDICMKLIHAENREELSDDDEIHRHRGLTI